MGCLNSKSTTEKSKTTSQNGHKAKAPPVTKANGAGPDAGGKASNEPPRAEADASPQQVTRTFLKTVLEGAEHFFSSLPDSQTVKQVVALTFINSCVEVTRTKYRLKTDDIIDLVTTLTQQLKLPLLQGSMSGVEERSMDDSFSRILIAWVANNPSLTRKISAEAAQAVLDTLYIRYAVVKQTSFEDILVYQFRWISVNQVAMEVFAKFAEGREAMTPEQMGKFLRETQGIEITDRQLMEKVKFRFGGGIHRYNFASYNGSVLTNNAIDPARVSNVWQDMTQSFTHYRLQSTRIESEEDLKRASTDNTRAYMLNIRKEGGQLCSGTCPLRSVFEAIKKFGFATNTYPIVLCLSPGKSIPVALQTELAHELSEGLGTLLAKGLMFEGAVISDPKFNPGALRKKVLIMGPQCNLKPFIGFMVADMAKDGLGVRVTDVVELTPAAKGGVLKDDWLTHFNDEPIHNKQHLRERLAKLRVGEEFSVKRENLDEIKIVVGGVVDTEDKTASPELSALVFFKYAPASEHPKPWDTERIDAAKLSSMRPDPKRFADHFGIVSIDGKQGADDDAEGQSSRLGIQFVDLESSERCLAWSRGRFCDNGRCGYLLGTDIGFETTSDLSISIIGGPRVLGIAALASATVKIHGGGTSRQSGVQLTFSGCNESSIAVVQMKFESNGIERGFTASFSPALIRPGYHALPCIAAGEERSPKKHIHGVYIFASKGK